MILCNSQQALFCSELKAELKATRAVKLWKLSFDTKVGPFFL